MQNYHSFYSQCRFLSAAAKIVDGRHYYVMADGTSRAFRSSK